MMDKQHIRDRLEASVGGEERFADSFSVRTFRDLRERAKRELDDGAQMAVEALANIDAALRKSGLEQYSQHDQEQFVARFVSKWSAYQHAGARTANWAVVGPARFPVERNRKAMDRKMRLLNEFIQFRNEAPARAVKAAKRARARDLGTDGMASEELADLKARLAKREASQRYMKDANAIIRRGKFGPGDGQAFSDALKAAGYDVNPNRAGILLQPSYGSPGYPSYSLSNNNAEIHRLRDRVAQVEAKLQRIESDEAPEREINGVRVVEDRADDRLRLFFDGKPQPSVIAALKSRGFRWSPSQGAWQRQLTDNARYAAEYVLNQIPA